MKIKHMWDLRNVQVVRVVVGALGSIIKDLNKLIGKLGMSIIIEFLQKTTLLGSPRILGKDLEL